MKLAVPSHTSSQVKDSKVASEFDVFYVISPAYLAFAVKETMKGGKATNACVAQGFRNWRSVPRLCSPDRTQDPPRQELTFVLAWAPNTAQRSKAQWRRGPARAGLLSRRSPFVGARQGPVRYSLVEGETRAILAYMSATRDTYTTMAESLADKFTKTQKYVIRTFHTDYGADTVWNSTTGS